MATVRTLTIVSMFVCALSGCAHKGLLGVSENTLAVTPTVALSGSLRARAPELLERQNAVVIDLRRADEGAELEAQQMQSSGVTYFNLPISSDSLDTATVDRLDTLLSAHSQHPIILHCRSGNRAGLMWAALLKNRGESSAAAISAVSEIVNSPKIRQAIREYTSEVKQ